MAEPARIPPRLRLCRGCARFVPLDRPACLYCGADLDALDAAHQARRAAIRAAADALRQAMSRPRPG
jgi:hypothetical protein